MNIGFIFFGSGFVLSGIAAIYLAAIKQVPGHVKEIVNRWPISGNTNRPLTLMYGIMMVLLGTILTVVGIFGFHH